MADQALETEAVTASGTEEIPTAAYCMLVLALIGIADAFYDSYMIYTGHLLWCPPPIDGCNIVASSPYARIFDMPLGYFGFVYYLYMFGLAALLASDPFSRGLRFYAAIGVLSSICFMYIQFTFIHAFCIYCAISAALTLLLFLAALWHVRTMSVAPHRQLSGGRWPASHRAVHQTR